MKQPKSQPQAATKAAIYCRVSTYNQGQGDYSSLKTQEDLLRSYCKTKGWDIFDIYVDTRTGTTMEREALNKLLQDAQDRKFNIVLATKLDRLSRSMKDFFEINEALAANNVDIVLATQNIDTTSSMGRFNRNVLMAFAEFERDMIAERTLEKLYSQAQKGYWGGGHAPLGYSVTDKKLFVEPTEAELVKRIFRYYLEDPSTTRVAERLNSEGYRTKTRLTKSGKRTGAARFTKQSVRGILLNKVYLGTIKFSGEEFKGIHVAIVGEPDFAKVNAIMGESAKNPRASSPAESPLTLLGITQCGHCESLLSSSSTFKKKQQRRYYYYKC
jgi:site-specific DNA recombinase